MANTANINSISCICLTSSPSTSITSLNTCSATSWAESLSSWFWLTMTRVTVETEPPVCRLVPVPFGRSTETEQNSRGRNDVNTLLLYGLKL